MEKQKDTNDEPFYMGFCCIGEAYISPSIEIVEITIEKGFADSAEGFGEGTW